MSRGKLICLEGGDGAGKSTQIELIKNYLDNHKLSYSHFHFPVYGHNQFSDIIARFLRGEFGAADEVDPLFVANIYAMDRFRFLPELEKALEENDVVLLDRYVFSNVAYQCAKFDNKEDAERMKEWIIEFEFHFLKLPYPDLNIFLNVPKQITQNRLKQKREGSDRDYLNGKQDIHEADFKFQEKVRKYYTESMLSSINCKIIDCAIQQQLPSVWESLTPKEIFDSYKKYLDNVLLNIEL